MPGSRREALDAVARAVAQAVDRNLGDDLGFFARRRVARARAFAETHLPPPGNDPVGERVHRMQVMWLRLGGHLLPNDRSLTDPKAASDLYYAHLAHSGPSVPKSWWTWKKAGAIVGIVAFLGTGVAVTLHFANAPTPPKGEGEMMAADTEGEFVSAFTDWVIALDRWTRLRHGNSATTTTLKDARDKLDARRARMLTPAVLEFFGEAAAEEFGEVLDLTMKVAEGRDWESAEDDLAEGIRDLNRALREAKRGYFLDSYAVLYQEDDRPETALYLFRVIARRLWKVEHGPVDEVEALHLRRLDRLNLVQLMLGYTSKRMDVAALLLDHIEEDLAARIGPSISPDSLMPPPVDSGEEPESWEWEYRRAAGIAIHAAVAAEHRDDLAGYEALGAGLRRRVELQSEWNKSLGARGMRLSAFEGLTVADSVLDEVEQRLGARERARIDEIQKVIDTDDNRRRFATLLERHARSVERHEVQHRLDYALGDDFVVPDAVLALLGIPKNSPDARRDDVQRVALELSAYTSEIARDPTWAAVNLTLITEHLIEGGGGAEGYSAILILDALREELRLPGLRLADTPPVSAARGADAYLALIVVPSENLARAAQAVWERWYGRALPTLTPASELAREGAVQ